MLLKLDQTDPVIYKETEDSEFALDLFPPPWRFDLAYFFKYAFGLHRFAAPRWRKNL